uniref:Transposase n=1 Tax=Globodera pallida TaxID=36090 RepID=A0A183CT73_GLOPA
PCGKRMALSGVVRRPGRNGKGNLVRLPHTSPCPVRVGAGRHDVDVDADYANYGLFERRHDVDAVTGIFA